MFFLLRLTFWLGLVLVLLPREPAEAPTTTQLDAAQAISAATAAVSDMARFCTRQPAACEAGGQAAALIGERAQGGARKVYQFLIEQNEREPAAGKTDDNTGKSGARTGAEPRGAEHTGSIAHPVGAMAAGDDTLTTADRRMPWRMPALARVDQG
jgi:hypothetical protein